MVEQISLPVVIPDRLLISPGIWNDNEYSAKEIGEAFARTSWDDKDKISLWLNHDDTNTSAFVGYVKNPKLASRGRVFGDLEIWDEKTATILTQAMAKFGVSAKIKGEEDKTGKMHNFSFENFSVVTVPACSEAYINLAKKETKTISKYLLSKKDNLKLVGKTSHSNITERRLENMAEDKKEEVVEEKAEEKAEEKTEEATEEKEAELSEKDMLKSLCEKFDKLVALLSKKLEAEEPAEAPEEKAEETVDPEEDKLLPKEEDKNDEPKEEVEKENKELTAVKKELAEIKEKLKAPKSKTVRNLSSNTVGENTQFDLNEFGNLLGTTERPMKFM